MSDEGNSNPKWPIIKKTDHIKVCKAIQVLRQNDDLEGDNVGPILFYLESAGKRGLIDRRMVKQLQIMLIKFIFERMRNVPIIDLAVSFQYLPLLGSDKKILRFLTKVEEMIELTNPKLLKHVEVNAFISIMLIFRESKIGSQEFKDKCALVLQNCLERNRWTQLTGEDIAALLSCLTKNDIKKCEPLIQ